MLKTHKLRKSVKVLFWNYINNPRDVEMKKKINSLFDQNKS